MNRTLLSLLLIIAGILALPLSAQEDASASDASTQATDSVQTASEQTASDTAASEKTEDRITFNVRLSEARGGGRVIGSAGNIELKEGEFLIATDGVELRYRDLVMTAHQARVDIPTNLLTAEGQVVLDEGPQRLTGDTLEYDLTNRTGKVSQATAYVDPDYYFSGAQIAKVGDDTYTIDDGIFTSCEQDVPAWSIHLTDARVTLDEYARIRNARLKFKKLPVLYVPYMLWPATTERTSGFLVPKPGYSERRGASLDLAYYKTLGRGADTTFFLDLSSKEYFGFGNETRWRPAEQSEGYFRAYVIDEPEEEFFSDENIFDPTREAGDTRWKFELFHKTEDLWDKFRAVVSFQDYSDFDYLQDFERNVNRQTRSFIYSNAFLSGNFGQQSLNILVDKRDRIQTSGLVDERLQLPEIEYRLRPTRLGNTPIYFSLDSSLHYLSVRRENVVVDNPNTFLDNEYGRAHIAPRISVPLSGLSWLSAKLNLGGRATYYSDVLAVEGEGDDQVVLQNEFSGDEETRVIPEASLEVIGPVLSRIFDKEKGRYAKLKHVIEPRVTYSFVDEFEEQGRIFRFDELDSLTPSNGYVVSLINRLVAKPRDEEEGGAVEIGSFELRQGFSLDDDKPLQGTVLDGTTEGPLQGILRINPSRSTSIRSDVRYNTFFSNLQSVSFTGEKWFGGRGEKLPLPGRHKLALTWRTNWNAQTGNTTSDQVRVFAKLGLIPQRLNLDAELSYDLENSELLQQRYFVNWTSQCYGWQLEFRESKFADIEDRDFRFSLTLKNVGTFLDLNESF